MYCTRKFYVKIGVGVIAAVFALSGCSTTYRYFLDQNANHTRFYDQKVVASSVKKQSAVEVRFRSRSPAIVDIYVKNISKTDLNFDPANVAVVAVTKEIHKTFKGPITHYVIRVLRGSPPAPFSNAYARLYGATPVTATGGLEAFLNGASIGESIIAANQSSAEAAASNQAVQSTAQSTRKSLIGLTTLRPGDSISGGVGFLVYSDQVFYTFNSRLYVYSPDADGKYSVYSVFPSILKNPQAVYKAFEKSDQSSRWGEGTVYTLYLADAGEQWVLSEPKFIPVSYYLLVRVGDDVHVFQLDSRAVG
jgi:hypothetical protein